MLVLGLFACGQASYSERLDAYRAAMTPVLEEAKALDLAALPAADPSTAKGRKVLFIENGAAVYETEYVDGEDRIPATIAGTPEEVGVFVVVTSKRNAEKSWSYDDGTAGYGQAYTFVAVSRPEHAVLARWTGAASPGLQKLITSNRDEIGYYTDWAEDAQQLLAGQDPGQTEMGAASEALKAALAPVVDAVRALESTGEPVLGAIPAGRKVLVTTNGYAHDVSYHPPPWAALDAASVGIVASVERVPDETPSALYDDGVPGYGATFTITVRTWPDQTIVRRWTEHHDPPSSVFDAKRTRVDAYYDLSDLGAAVYAGRDTAPIASP